MDVDGWYDDLDGFFDLERGSGLKSRDVVEDCCRGWRGIDEDSDERC